MARSAEWSVAINLSAIESADVLQLEATMLSATSAIADILITIALSLSLTQSRTGVKRRVRRSGSS